MVDLVVSAVIASAPRLCWPAAKLGPGDLDQAVGVVEETQGDGHQVVDAVGAHHLHRVAPARLGPQGGDGHDQGVGDLPVVMVTFTGAWSHVPVAAGSVGFTSTVMVGSN